MAPTQGAHTAPSPSARRAVTVVARSPPRSTTSPRAVDRRRGSAPSRVVLVVVLAGEPLRATDARTRGPQPVRDGARVALLVSTAGPSRQLLLDRGTRTASAATASSVRSGSPRRLPSRPAARPGRMPSTPSRTTGTACRICRAPRRRTSSHQLEPPRDVGRGAGTAARRSRRGARARRAGWSARPGPSRRRRRPGPPVEAHVVRRHVVVPHDLRVGDGPKNRQGPSSPKPATASCSSRAQRVRSSSCASVSSVASTSTTVPGR